MSETGAAQAAQLGASFAGRDDLVLLTSPRRRARQTALAIGTAAGVQAESHPGLDEVDFGHWSGCSFDSLAMRVDWRQWNESRASAATPAGDTMQSIQARILKLIDQAHLTHAGRTIVLVTHAEVIRAALLHYLDAVMDEYRHLPIDTASVSSIDFRYRQPVRIGINKPRPAPRRPR